MGRYPLLNITFRSSGPDMLVDSAYLSPASHHSPPILIFHPLTPKLQADTAPSNGLSSRTILNPKNHSRQHLGDLHPPPLDPHSPRQDNRPSTTCRRHIPHAFKLREVRRTARTTDDWTGWKTDAAEGEAEQEGEFPISKVVRM